MAESGRAERVGLYPGTFDPVTNGHLDVIGRAARLVDRLVIGVAQNDDKGPLFTTDERVEMLRAEVAPLRTMWPGRTSRTSGTSNTPGTNMPETFMN